MENVSLILPFCFLTLCGQGHHMVFLKEIEQHIRDLCLHVITISYLRVVTDWLASGWYVWVLEMRHLIMPGRNDDIPWVQLLWVEQILTHHVTCSVKEKKRNIWHSLIWLQSQQFNFTSLLIKHRNCDIVSRPIKKKKKKPGDKNMLSFTGTINHMGGQVTLNFQPIIFSLWLLFF